MKINILSDYNEMCRETAEYIAGFVNRKPGALLCFPSGDTPAGVFKVLIEYARSGRVDFSHCRFVGLDEWVGMGENDPGSCKQFIYDNFFNPLSILPSNIWFFDACSEDLQSECKKADEYIAENGPIDLMLVGIGMNGHIGLNEPGVSFELYSHIAELSDTTKIVARKYFTQPVHIVQGITLGLRHLREAGTVMLIASGSKKAEILCKSLTGPITPDVPASIVQSHPNGVVMADRDAAKFLKV